MTRRCPWWRGHTWRTTGVVDFTTWWTCTRCGWTREHDTENDMRIFYAPDSWKEQA